MKENPSKLLQRLQNFEKSLTGKLVDLLYYICRKS